VVRRSTHIFQEDIMGVDNQRVCEIITDKLKWSKGASRPERIGDAFDLISQDREGGYADNLNYAAAEHYLFARWLCANLGFLAWPWLQVGNLLYEGVKTILPDSMTPRFGKGPPAPSSPAELLWGARGGNDGLKDATFAGGRWLNPNADVPPPPSACGS
jgi:hypothetical protein